MSEATAITFKLTSDMAMNIIKIVTICVIIFISVGVVLELFSPNGRGHDLAVILITSAVTIPNTLLGVLGVGHLQKGNDPSNPLYTSPQVPASQPLPVKESEAATDSTDTDPDHTEKETTDAP